MGDQYWSMEDTYGDFDDQVGAQPAYSNPYHDPHSSESTSNLTYAYSSHNDLSNKKNAMHDHSSNEGPQNRYSFPLHNPVGPSSYIDPQGRFSAVQHDLTSQSSHHSIASSVYYNTSITGASMSPYPSSTAWTASHTLRDDQVEATAKQMKALLHKSAMGLEYMPNTQIQGEADFKLKMQAYLTLCDENETGLYASSDFPQDPQTQQQLVRELIEAMIYLGENCEDTTSKKSVNRLKKLSPIEFDLMAWKILLECRDAQQGKVSMPRWGIDWDMQHFDSFHERFESVRSSLRMRKSMVTSCFDNVFSKRMVANPHKETRLKKANKDVNSKRAEDLDLAKRVKKVGQSVLYTPHESPEDAQSDVMDEAGPLEISSDMAAGSEVVAGMGSRTGGAPAHNTMVEDSGLRDIVNLDQEWMEQMFQDEWAKNNSGYVVPRMF